MNRLMFVLILSLFLDVGAYGQGTEEGPMLPEYLYAHLDRDLYVAGEQLWYSVYFLQPQDYLRSKVVHVEVLNPRGEVVAHNQHPVQGNAATGDIYLESSWNPGRCLQ